MDESLVFRFPVALMWGKEIAVLACGAGEIVCVWLGWGL